MEKIILLFLLFMLISCNTSRQIKEISLDETHIKSGKEHWTGENDCSALVTLSKDHKGIFIDVHAKDDYLFESPDKWSSDAIELFFDFRPLRQRKINTYQKGVFQLVIEPGFKTRKDRISYYPSTYATMIPGATVHVNTFKIGYHAKIFLPYDGLQKVHYLPRSEFKFDISIQDIDSINIKTKLIWNGNGMNWNNPQNFGLIKSENNNEE